MPADAIKLRAIAAGVSGIFRIGWNTDRLEPVGPAVDDVRHAGERFDVVDDCRLAERPFDGREWRLDPRPAALAFEAFDQARLLAADIRRRAAMEINVAVEIFAEDVLAGEIIGG